jgi:hypothetical protein
MSLHARTNRRRRPRRAAGWMLALTLTPAPWGCGSPDEGRITERMVPTQPPSAADSGPGNPSGPRSTRPVPR